MELSGATPNKKEGEKGDGDQKKDVKEDDRSNKKDEKKNSNFKATPEYVFAP